MEHAIAVALHNRYDYRSDVEIILFIGYYYIHSCLLMGYVL